MISSNPGEGAPGPSLLGTGEGERIFAAGPSPVEVSLRCMKGRVAPVSMISSNPDEGAPGPSLLGTGEGEGILSAGPSTVGVSLRGMKGQRIRYQQTGEFHFLTFSCYRRCSYLSTVAAMELFEDALERVRQRYL